MPRNPELGIMQFTLWRLLFGMTLLAIWMGGIARGFEMGQSDGAIALGVCGFIGLGLTALIVARWRNEQLFARVLAIAVASLFLFPLMLPARFRSDFRYSELTRQLNRELHLDRRYLGVTLKYVPRDSNCKGDEYLSAEGEVATFADRRELQKVLESRVDLRVVEGVYVKEASFAGARDSQAYLENR